MEVEGYFKVGDKYYKNEEVQRIFDLRIKSYSEEEITEEPEGEEEGEEPEGEEEGEGEEGEEE